MVVDESGDAELTRPRSAADRIRGLEDLHVDTIAREVQGSGQPVGSGADDYRCGHCAVLGRVTGFSVRQLTARVNVSAVSVDHCQRGWVVISSPVSGLRHTTVRSLCMVGIQYPKCLR